MLPGFSPGSKATPPPGRTSAWDGAAPLAHARKDEHLQEAYHVPGPSARNEGDNTQQPETLPLWGAGEGTMTNLSASGWYKVCDDTRYHELKVTAELRP